MAQKYSDKRLAALARFFDSAFTHAEMDVLFLSVSVPEEFDRGDRISGIKLKRAVNVVTGRRPRAVLAPAVGVRPRLRHPRPVSRGVIVMGSGHNTFTAQCLHSCHAW
jgi:hypothetical protein